MTKIISCNVHDYFEIACMRKSVIDIELQTKQSIQGIAVDIFARKGREYLKIETRSAMQEIELTHIAFLTFKENGERIKVS